MAELSHQHEDTDKIPIVDPVQQSFPILAHANPANAITSASIAFGIGASLLVIESYLLAALVLGPLTIVCDTLDGLVARRMNTSSTFGAQLDSLADAIAFGVFPAILGYGLGMKGPLEIFLVWYVLGALWRLARFGLVGLKRNAAGSECFEGVPTSFMAATLYVITPVVLRLPDFVSSALLVGFFAVGPLLMNSNLLFPKSSLLTRAMWVLVPLALISSWQKLL